MASVRGSVRTWTHPLVLGAGFAVLSLLANGYEFGTSDHAIHLPFADMVLHPERWKGDLLLEAFPRHRSLFSYLFAAFAFVLGPALAAAVLHLAALCGTGAALTLLARRLWDGDRVVPAVLLATAPAHLALGGVDTFDPRLLHRGVALPVELLSLWLLLSGRSAGAFLLAGFAVTLHAPSGVACAVALLLAQLSFVRQEGPRALGPPLLSLVGAAPILVPMFRAEGLRPLLVPMDERWWSVLAARLGHHVDPAQWPIGHFVLFGATVVLAALSIATAPPQRAARTPFVLWLLGLLLVVAGPAFVTGPSGPALLLQLEPWQASRLVVLLGVAATAAWIAELRPADAPSAALRVAAFVLVAVGQPVAALPVLILLRHAGSGGIVALGKTQAYVGALWFAAILLGSALSAWASVETVPWLAGFDVGREGPVRLGWFLDVGPAAALLLAGAVAVRGQLLSGSSALQPEDWVSAKASRGLRWTVAAALLLAGRLPADGRSGSRFLPLGPRSEMAEAAQAAASLLPEGSLLAGPPHLLHEARPYLPVAMVVTWKDGGEALFDRDVAMRWLARLESACGCEPLRPPDATPREAAHVQAEFRRRIGAGQFAIRPEGQLRAAQEARATHLFVSSFDPKSLLPGQEPIWRNAAYHLYAVAPR